MLVQRRRAVIYAVSAIAAIWVVALTGYFIAKNSKMTAEKVRAYAESVDLTQLAGADRANAIQKLADKLNALPYEERQRARFDHVGMMWFNGMTDNEKAGFIDQTLPTGFKQMITAFEQMPEDKRRKLIDDSFRQLNAAREKLQSGEFPAPGGPGGPPPPGVTPELEKRIRTIGLQAYFTQSSAQTKAELAPLLEELQRVMEMGGRVHHR
jgi:hypothetical protein